MSSTKVLKKLRYDLGRRGLRTPLVWLRHRGLSENDVFLASYPRAGSTWLRFQLHHAITGERPGFAIVDKALPDVGGQRGAIRIGPSARRLIKTHELPRPEYRRVVWLVRDPRDVVLSEHAYLTMRGLAVEPIEEFVTRFVGAGVNSFGSWAEYTHLWLKHRDSATVLTVRYEDLRAQPVPELERVLDFLDVRPAESLDSVVEAASLESMKRTEERAREAELSGRYVPDSDLRFVRSGKASGWRSELDPDLATQVVRGCPHLVTTLGYDDLL